MMKSSIKVASTQKPLTAKAAFMLACIMMMENKDSEDDTTQIVRALHGAISCPDWQAASTAWELRESPEDCLQLLKGTMNREQSNCAIANLTEIALAAGVLSDESRILLHQINDVLEPMPGLLDQAIFIIGSKNNRDALTSTGNDVLHQGHSGSGGPLGVYH